LSVILFLGKRYEYRYIEKKANLEADKHQKLHFGMLYIELGNALYLVIINLIAFIYSINLYKENSISIGDITFVLFMMINVSNVLKQLARDILRFLQNLGTLSEVLNLIKNLEIIEDKRNAYPIKITSGIIEFKECAFSYDANKDFLKNLSLIINSKQKVIILGRAGSGKTTFVELILRLFKLSSGDILIDNQSINDVTQNSLYKAISVVPQNPILFNRSIMHNIKYGNPKTSTEEVISASKTALSHDFIIQLPNGYNTIVGERGEKLSGGQRKLIAIARVILKNNKILILDEFTSNLDIVSKQKLKKQMQKFLQNKTVLSITHCVEDAFDAERVLLFEDGCIVADGTHLELAKQNPHYKEFIKRFS
jgi:ATP-binding cassette subfamily B protein